MCKYYKGMSNYAEKCKDFEESKQTNADRIRSMSYEELADMLHNNGSYVEKWRTKARIVD